MVIWIAVANVVLWSVVIAGLLIVRLRGEQAIDARLTRLEAQTSAVDQDQPS